MKIKCKMCGLKGYWDVDKMSEFWASRFLTLHSFQFDKGIKFICRDCVSKVLSALQSESHKIEQLHKPEIEEK